MHLYDVIDVDRKNMIMTAATQTEIQNFVGRHIVCNTYAKSHHAVTVNNRRYKIFVSGEKIPVSKVPKMHINADKFADDWSEMQKMFSHVKWQKEWKPGVIKLGE